MGDLEQAAAAADEEDADLDVLFASSSSRIWSDFRSALKNVDQQAIRTALSKQDSIASISSIEDIDDYGTELELLTTKIQKGEALSEQEAASIEVVESAAAEARSLEPDPPAGGKAVQAMWAVLRKELLATSEVVDRELAALDAELDVLDDARRTRAGDGEKLLRMVAYASAAANSEHKQAAAEAAAAEPAAADVAASASDPADAAAAADSGAHQATDAAAAGSAADAAARPIEDQLRDALASKHVRVLDLFRTWDRDGDFRIGKKELRRAVLALGCARARAFATSRHAEHAQPMPTTRVLHTILTHELSYGRPPYCLPLSDRAATTRRVPPSTRSLSRSTPTATASSSTPSSTARSAATRRLTRSCRRGQRGRLRSRR